MTFEFAKMHGAGNDFVAVLDPGAAFPLDDPALVRRLNAPHVGLVSEGMLVLRRPAPGEGADVRMVFFNPDGSRASMCGNGARCAAFLARRAGWAPARLRLATDAGTMDAEVLDDDGSGPAARVRIALSPPSGRRPRVRPDGAAFDYFAVDTGVPHAVAFVDGLDAVDVRREGALVRHSAAFAPAGTNVDFARVDGPRALSVRTYERGVEDETAACGTGSVAAAVAAVETGRCAPPVDVRVAFGDVLRVEGRVDADGRFGDLLLVGPARFVCRGVLDLAAFA